ncbi:MAG: XRE family transcriptional regulator [Sneathiella sp.]
MSHKDISTNSSTIVDDQSACLAKTIRQERLSRNWSLTELADQSGVSRAMIHKIENNISSPTAVLLGKLCGAFDITMSQLLATEKMPPKSQLTRSNQRKMWQDPGSGYMREQIAGGFTEGSESGIDIVKVTLPSGQRIDFPEDTYTFIRQCVWVQEGCLTFEEGNDVHTLFAGDCLTLGPPANCAFVNNSKIPCLYVVIVSRH